MLSGEKGAPAQLGQGPPEFRLKDNQEGDDGKPEDAGQQPMDGIQMKLLGGKKDEGQDDGV